MNEMKMKIGGPVMITPRSRTPAVVAQPRALARYHATSKRKKSKRKQRAASSAARGDSRHCLYPSLDFRVDFDLIRFDLIYFDSIRFDGTNGNQHANRAQEDTVPACMHTACIIFYSGTSTFALKIKSQDRYEKQHIIYIVPTTNVWT